MKKLLLTLALVSLVGVASAQDYSKKETREKLRNERTATANATVAAAVKAQNFTFGASFMMPLFSGTQQQLNSFTDIVAVYPKYLEVNLPYQTSASYDTTMGDKIVINNVDIQGYAVETASNGMMNISFNTSADGINYKFHIRYNPSNGSATLTVFPNMGDQITYTGSIHAN